MIKLLEATNANRTSDGRNKERPEHFIGVRQTPKQ